MSFILVTLGAFTAETAAVSHTKYSFGMGTLLALPLIDGRLN